MKRCRDNGSPCLVLLLNLKKPVDKPLFITQLSQFETNVLIHWMKLDPDQYFVKVARRKLCSIESKAFSISAANIRSSKFSLSTHSSKSL